jgi:hypothetical protein
MLDKLVVGEWGVAKEWLDAARSTDRSKRFTAWKEQAKLARKQSRRQKAQERDERKNKAKTSDIKRKEKVSKRQKIFGQIEGADTDCSEQ